MNRGDLDRLIEAVLYEGYILYPYRRSIKNVQRWTFGGIHPPSYREVREGSEACWKETECLVFGDERTMLGVTLRFLHLVDRQIGQAAGPVHPETAVEQIPFEPVAALQVGPREFHPWREAIEREVILPTTSLGELSAQASIVELAFPAHRQVEPIRDADGRIVGASIREQQAVAGSIEARAVRLRESLFKISVTIANESTLEPEAQSSRDEAVLRSFASANVVLTACQGEFVSLIDPPATWSEAASSCHNNSLWPVLVGQPPDRNTLLCAPIILVRLSADRA